MLEPFRRPIRSVPTGRRRVVADAKVWLRIGGEAKAGYERSCFRFFSGMRGCRGGFFSVKMTRAWRREFENAGEFELLQTFIYSHQIVFG
jgi:hypothetical protein